MKRPLLLGLAAMAAVTPALSGRAQPYPINPGHWEATTSIAGFPVATDHWCVQPKDIHKFLGGLSNHIYHCDYPLNSAEGGQIRFKGQCTQTKRGKLVQQFNLEGDGGYTPTTVHMKAHMCCIKWNGLPIGGDAHLDGHFVSADCPAEAKPFKD